MLLYHKFSLPLSFFFSLSLCFSSLSASASLPPQPPIHFLLSTLQTCSSTCHASTCFSPMNPLPQSLHALFTWKILPPTWSVYCLRAQLKHVSSKTLSNLKYTPILPPLLSQKHPAHTPFLVFNLS